MKSVLNFLWLAVRCVAFIWIVTTILILILFAVGTEAEGYSWGERLVIAIKYGGYVGGIFGTLLAIFVWWQNWKIIRRNRKKMARRDTT
jgi:hypothetical protein